MRFFAQELPAVECGTDGCPGVFVPGEGVAVVLDAERILLFCSVCAPGFGATVVAGEIVGARGERTPVYDFTRSYDA